MSIIYSAFCEVAAAKMDVKNWILESSEALYDTETMQSKSFAPTSLSRKAKDLFSQQELFRDIHGSLVMRMCDFDNDDLTINVRPTFLDLSRSQKLMFIKAVLQNIIVSEDYLTYIGFGLNRKDEKHKKLQSKFAKLNCLSLEFRKSNTLGEIIEPSDLLDLISKPIMGYSPLWADEKIQRALSADLTGN